jgi:hypothetical protein
MMVRRPTMVLVMRARLMMQPSEMTAWSICAPLILEPGRKRGRLKTGALMSKKLKRGSSEDEIQIRLKKGADGSDVLPVALKNVGENAARGDGLRDDVLAEIRQELSSSSQMSLRLKT